MEFGKVFNFKPMELMKVAKDEAKKAEEAAKKAEEAAKKAEQRLAAVAYWVKYYCDWTAALVCLALVLFSLLSGVVDFVFSILLAVKTTAASKAAEVLEKYAAEEV